MKTPRSAAGSVPASYFETKFKNDIDPWQFRTSAYERAKFQATIDALAQPSYQSVLEIGCAIGELSALIAPRCERLFALDASSTAIKEAQSLQLANVSFAQAVMPADFPEGRFDLIILSEVLYYFSEDELFRLARSCADALKRPGEIIMCHWLGETDYPLSGARASDLFASLIANRLPERTELHHDVYRLERLCAAR